MLNGTDVVTKKNTSNKGNYTVRPDDVIDISFNMELDKIKNKDVTIIIDKHQTPHIKIMSPYYNDKYLGLIPIKPSTSQSEIINIRRYEITVPK